MIKYDKTNQFLFVQFPLFCLFQLEHQRFYRSMTWFIYWLLCWFWYKSYYFSWTFLLVHFHAEVLSNLHKNFTRSKTLNVVLFVFTFTYYQRTTLPFYDEEIIKLPLNIKKNQYFLATKYEIKILKAHKKLLAIATIATFTVHTIHHILYSNIYIIHTHNIQYIQKGNLLTLFIQIWADLKHHANLLFIIVCWISWINFDLYIPQILVE